MSGLLFKLLFHLLFCLTCRIEGTVGKEIFHHTPYSIKNLRFLYGGILKNIVIPNIKWGVFELMMRYV
ncbi:hypothetical protein GYH30_023876 [Glycine max]|uniref:Secreted protein n=1 Tax=Glycine max TaxID=3847 RepID=A0A0R0IC69_SOYBN|nr:hypothetical protein GYH30_023876 [Glycine max]